MNKSLDIDVFWTIQHGQKWSTSLTDTAARECLTSLAAYGEDPIGWTIERTHEKVPIATGEFVEGCGEAITFDDDGNEAGARPYKTVHVFWQCPFCGHRHNGNIRRNPLDAGSAVSNPSLWFCELGKGLVLLGW